MIAPLAHIAGFPLEEILPSLAGLGTALLIARSRLAAGLRARSRR